MCRKLFSIVCLVLLLSCEKQSTNEIAVTFPVTLTANSIELKPGLRLFTKTGEIMNSEAISSKLIANFGYFNMTNQQASTSFPKLNFVSADTVKFVPFLIPSIHSVQKTGNSIVFTSTHLSSYKADEILLFIRKLIQPLTPAAPNSGYAYVTHLLTPATGTYTELALPFLSIMIKKPTNGGFSQSSDLIFNELDPAVFQKLGTNDTLVVQEGIARFK